MPESQVIARRFRPQTFGEVVGQEAITRTLTNSIESNRLHHAYLFSGARGVGKTTTARILAKALNCTQGITTAPCGSCPPCIEIAASSSIDVLEIDAASNTGVDNVRDSIINTVSISPARDRYKIFIIDEVHQLSSAAFNALLKTLEEPPPHVLFIMATTELHKVPETIMSRCQVFEFRTISSKRISDQLRKIANDLGVEIGDSAILSLARAGEGSMRDAESALDQVLSFAGKTVTPEDVSQALGLVDSETLNTITRSIADEDSSAVLRIVDEIVARGYDLRNLCRGLMAHIRSLLVIRIAGFDQELIEASREEADSLVQLAESFSEQDLIRFFSILTKTEQDIRLSSQPRFQLEVGLIKLAQAHRLYLIEDALEELRKLRSQLSGSESAPRTTLQPAIAERDAKTVSRAGGPGQLTAPARQARPMVAPLQSASRPEERTNREARVANEAAARRPQESDLDKDLQDQQSIQHSTSKGIEWLLAVVQGLVRDDLERQKTRIAVSVGATDISLCLPADFQWTKAQKPRNRRVPADRNTFNPAKEIEEWCRKAGHELTVSITVQTDRDSSPPALTATSEPGEQQSANATDLRKKAEMSPAVRLLTEKVHGEVVEIIKPEN